jgi:outer membrane receptor protein involved in Fe transport
MKKTIDFSVVSRPQFLLSAVFILLASIANFGQQTTGTLRGVIFDQNGAVVPGASVFAKNEATGVETVTATTNQEGIFVFTNLLPGSYSVTVSTASGFKKKTVSGLTVNLGLDREVKVDLEVGSAQEIVEIVAGAEEIAQTTSQISTNFSSQKVSELPSNAAGSGIDTLALNIPGVTPGFGNVNSNGTTLSVNGNRARANNFSIDGTDNNDLTIGGPSLFVSNTEIVQEFQVITNQYSAEYGRNQGAIVNIVTKGGTNSFHGTAFEYHRNASLLDAMSNIERRTATRSLKDKFISNTFGGTFGGPIVRNKAFFYGSFQGIRQAQNLTSRGGNPAILASEFARLRAAFPGNAAITALTTQGAFALTNFGTVRPRSDVAATRVCISATPAVNCVTTSPQPVGTDQTGFFAAAFPEREFPFPFTQNDFTIRGDWNITSKDNVSVRYLWQDNVQTNSLGNSTGFTGDVPATSKNLSGFYTRQISSSIVNNFQATTQRLSILFGGGCEDALTGCIPDPIRLGEAYTSVVFGGVTALNGAALQTIGGATNLPQGRIVDVIQFSDKVSWTRGSHTILFGADIRLLETTAPFLPNINGVFRYNNLTSLVTNIPSQVTLGDGNPNLLIKQKDRFFFFQDDWRAMSNLTLNLGVRYEYSGQPLNGLHDQTLARESDATTALYRQNVPIEARTVPKLPADKNNWAPRLGFAWTPKFGDGALAKFLFGENDASVFRGGFSMAYEAVFYNIAANISTSAPAVILDTFVPTIGMPASPTGTTVRSAFSSNLRRNTFDPRLLAQTDVSSDFHSPYSYQYSFGIQRQINASNVFEIRYVGNKGKSLFQTVNGNPNYANLWNGFTLGAEVFPAFRNLLGNAPAPQTTTQCFNDPATPDNEGACAGRLLPGRGLIRSRTNTGSSSYDSLQTRYNGRFIDKRLNLGLTYTWSKALDNASEIFAFGETPIAQNPFDVQAAERSISGFDRPHAFSMNFIYDVPFYKEQSGFAGKLLGGWQINGTYNLASGRPFTPEQSRNISLTAFGGGYTDAGFAANFIGLDSLRPFVGNPNVDLRLVAVHQVDARLMGFITAANVSPTGFYLLNDLNRRDAAGARILTPVAPNDVRFILNGPGAARAFNNPFGTAARNSVRGKILNQMNLGVFKTTNITERFKIQFRAEAFNVTNTPNAGFGVAGGASIPGLLLENAGVAGSAFGDSDDVALSSRRVQFGLRIIF